MSWFSHLVDRYARRQAYKWGKSRAKMKLLAFYTYQNKFPELPVEELYYLTVLNSVGFTETTAIDTVTRAQEMADGHVGSSKLASPGEPFSLRIHQ